MTAAAALAELSQHIGAYRDRVMTTHEHPSHRGSVSLDACVALDAIAVAVAALIGARAEIEEGTSALESLSDEIYDMVSDIAGEAIRRMEEPAFDPHSDWQKHEPRSAA